MENECESSENEMVLGVRGAMANVEKKVENTLHRNDIENLSSLEKLINIFLHE